MVCEGLLGLEDLADGRSDFAMAYCRNIVVSNSYEDLAVEGKLHTSPSIVSMPNRHWNRNIAVILAV
jgi:hypothetical protein